MDAPEFPRDGTGLPSYEGLDGLGPNPELEANALVLADELIGLMRSHNDTVQVAKLHIAQLLSFMTTVERISKNMEELVGSLSKLYPTGSRENTLITNVLGNLLGNPIVAKAGADALKGIFAGLG
jgi:hypothetical protein